MSAEEVIASVKNPAVVAAARLHRVRHRRAEGKALLEGPATLADAVQAGHRVHEVFGLDDPARSMALEAGCVFHQVTDQVLQRVAGTETPRGPVAVIDIPQPVIPPDRRLLVAWGVSDPGNCGTLLRTAAAFGYGYVAGPEAADSWSPKVLRSAAGGHFRTTVGRVGAVVELGKREIVGTVPSGGQAASGLSAHAAIVVGSEAHGLPPEVLERCDRLVSIPMPGGSESLNAAVAGAIVAYLGTTGTED